MANVKINNINTFNNTVLDIKSKVESSLKTDITSINSYLSSIENYRNNSFNANIGDIAKTLKYNYESILNNINNAQSNLFNYATCINKFNVDDYDSDAKATNLESLYNEKYLGIKDEKKENEKKTENKKSNNTNTNTNTNHTGSSFVVLGDNYSNSNSNNNSSNSNSNSNNNSNTNNNTSSNFENYLNTIEGTTIPLNNNLTSNAVSLNITNPNNIDSNTLKIINNQVYNEEGFATFQNRYIISTSKDLGMVGDLIDIKHNDGTVLKCIIGNVEENVTNQTINFIVNPNTFKTSIQTLHPNWLNSINEIKNKGNYFNYIK